MTVVTAGFGFKQEAADEAQAKAQAEGAYGESTSRYLDLATRESQLPSGAEWRTVRVKYDRLAACSRTLPQTSGFWTAVCWGRAI